MNYEHIAPVEIKPLLSENVSMFWCKDGWCYIPQLRVRQKFYNEKYFREEWYGVIPRPESIEQIQYEIYSYKPFTWREKSIDFDEFYQERE